MPFVKAAFIAVTAFILLLLGLMFFYPSSAKNIEQVLQLYQEGRYDEAEKKLLSLQKKIPPAQFHLYEAYISREKHNLTVSDQELQKALDISQNQVDLRLEIYINQAFNAFLQHRPEAMEMPLKQAQALVDQNDPWVNFLRSLQKYLNQNYATALSEMQKSSNRIPLSPWMKKAFESTFNPFWFTINTARANIEEGNYVLARQQLEEMSKSASDEQKNNINLLVGLSYIREAQEKPPLVSTPYYRLAFSYFNRVPLQNERYQTYRKEIFEQIKKQIILLLDQHQYQDLSFYTTALEGWGGHSEVKWLHQRLSELLKEELSANHAKGILQISTTLNRLIIESDQRQSIKNLFLEQLNKNLVNGNTSQLETIWQAFLLFNPDSETLSLELSKKVAKSALDAIPLDSKELTITAPYLDFWLFLVKDPQKRETFALELLDLSGKLFSSEGQSEKALNLLLLSTQIPALKNKKAFQAKLATVIKEIYGDILKKDDVQALKALQSATLQLNLPDLGANEKLDAAKQLQEAEHLFNTQHYQEAFKKGLWVLEISPGNPSAQKVVGLSAYELGLFSEAVEHLENLKNSSKEIKQALILSKTIQEDIRNNQQILAEFGENGEIPPEILFKLGLGNLIVNNPEGALFWLEQLKEFSDESEAALMIAFFQSGKWDEAIKGYLSLSPEYKQIPELKSAAIESLIMTGRHNEAEAVYKTYSNENVKQFSRFMQAILDPISQEQLSARYYNLVKNEPEKALEILKKLPVNPLIELEIGEIEFQIGKFQDAKATLLKALQTSEKTLLNKKVSKKALPLLAEIEENLGNPVNAVIFYSNFFKMYPHETYGRTSYGQVLQKVKRYDASLPYLNENTTHFVKALFHTGQFELARKKGKDLLNQLSPEEKLQLALILAPLKDEQLMQGIFKSLPAEKSWSLKMKETYFEFLLATDLKKAQTFAKENQKELEMSSQGLFLLARLNGQLSQAKQAIKYGQLALDKDPYNPEIIQFVESYQLNIPMIKKRLEWIHKKIDRDPDNISFFLDEANALIDFSLETHFAQPEVPFSQIPQLRSASAILHNLALNVKDLPRLYFLMGEVNYLLGDNRGALEAFQQALKLDVSYLEAYQYLSLVLRDLQHPDEALQVLQRALLFAPNDPEILQAMAGSFLAAGDTLDASNALTSALKFKPNDPNLYIKLAEMKLSLQNPQEAKILLEKAIALAPKNVKARILLVETLHHPLIKETISQQEKDTALKDLQQLDPNQAEILKNRE